MGLRDARDHQPLAPDVDGVTLTVHLLAGQECRRIGLGAEGVPASAVRALAVREDDRTAASTAADVLGKTPDRPVGIDPAVRRSLTALLPWEVQ